MIVWPHPRVTAFLIFLLPIFTIETSFAGPSFRVHVTASRSESSSPESLREINDRIADKSLFLATAGQENEEFFLKTSPEEWLSVPRISSSEDFIQLLRNILSTADRLGIERPAGFGDFVGDQWYPSEPLLVMQATLRKVFSILLEWNRGPHTVSEALSIALSASRFRFLIKSSEDLGSAELVTPSDALAVQKFMEESCIPLLNQIFERELRSHWTVNLNHSGDRLQSPRLDIELLRQLTGYAASYSVLLSPEQDFLSAIGLEGEELFFYARSGRNAIAQKFYSSLAQNLREASQTVWENAAKSEDFYTLIAKLIKTDYRHNGSLGNRHPEMQNEVAETHYEIVTTALNAASRVAGKVYWTISKRLLKLSEIFDAHWTSLPDVPQIENRQGEASWWLWAADFWQDDDSERKTHGPSWRAVLHAHLMNSHSSFGMPFDARTTITEMASLLGQNALRLSPEKTYVLLHDILYSGVELDPDNFKPEGKNNRIGVENALFEFMIGYRGTIPLQVYTQYKVVSSALSKAKSPNQWSVKSHIEVIEGMRADGRIDGLPISRIASVTDSLKRLALRCTGAFSK